MARQRKQTLWTKAWILCSRQYLCSEVIRITAPHSPLRMTSQHGYLEINLSISRHSPNRLLLLMCREVLWLVVQSTLTTYHSKHSSQAQPSIIQCLSQVSLHHPHLLRSRCFQNTSDKSWWTLLKRIRSLKLLSKTTCAWAESRHLTTMQF